MEKIIFVDKENKRKVIWAHPADMQSKNFKCSFCKNSVSSDTGYFANLKDLATGKSAGAFSIYFCPACGRPIFFDDSVE